VTRFGLKTIGLLLALLGLLLFLFLQARFEGTRRHDFVLGHLLNLKQLDATLDQEILRVRYNPHLDYDALVTTVTNQRTLLSELQHGPFAIYGMGQSDIEHGIDAYREMAELRQDVLERFKTENAVLRNSVSYFPVAIEEFCTDLRTDPHGHALAEQLQILLGQALAFEISPGLRSRQNLQAGLAELAKLRDASPLDLDAQIETVLQHGAMILKYQDAVNGYVDRLINLPASTYSDQIYASYIAYYNRTQDTARLYWMLLYGVSVLFLGCIGYAVVQLRRTALANDLANQSLRERSAELMRINNELENEIRERGDAERRLLQAKEEAELANRAKSEFLANMSHELRTPLNAVIGFSDLIRQNILGPSGAAKYKEYAEDINQSGLHLLGVINDILDLSKIEAGKVELDERDMNVGQAIDSCLILVRERAEKNRLAIERKLPSDLPLLRGDERKVRQILLNLLSNAVKFTPPGGTITIEARADSDGLRIDIVDTGIGIAPEDMEKALAPFGQIDSRISRRYEGTGLGLPLAKAFAELHGGTLNLQSAAGRGTRASVHFPPARSVVRAARSVAWAAKP
jgi:signal transduction histidine kinase